MVEKIIVNPNEIRGYGNVLNVHSSSDYDLSDCTIATGTDTVNGATETVYTLTPVFTHTYSLSFSSTGYTAWGGNASVSVTLTDNSVAVSGATITFTGGTSTVIATTNSNGVATATVTFSADGTLTATYDTASDTASITYSSIPYQTVEYLQSNGSQYINTGYTLSSNDKVEVSVSMQGSGTYNGVFGARKGSSSTNCYALFGRFGSANKFCYARTGNEKQGSTIQTNTVYDVTTTGSTCTIKQGSTTVETITSTGTINGCVNPCGLFVLNTSSTNGGFQYDTYGYMKIYSFKITNSSNEVVMDLVPVRDGTTGYMYDKVSGNLMTNNGTFLYGDDVSPSPSPTPTPTDLSLSFSNSSYQADLVNGTTVSCTLTDDGTPLSGETVTFSWESLGSTNTVTATTNSSGVATYAFEYWDFESFPATVTASYQGVTATCTIEAGGGGGGIV